MDESPPLGKSLLHILNCEFLLKFQDFGDIQAHLKAFLYYNNAKPHESQLTQEKIQQLHRQLLNLLPNTLTYPLATFNCLTH